MAGVSIRKKAIIEKYNGKTARIFLSSGHSFIGIVADVEDEDDAIEIYNPRFGRTLISARRIAAISEFNKEMEEGDF